MIVIVIVIAVAVVVVVVVIGVVVIVVVVVVALLEHVLCQRPPLGVLERAGLDAVLGCGQIGSTLMGPLQK